MLKDKYEGSIEEKVEQSVIGSVLIDQGTCFPVS